MKALAVIYLAGFLLIAGVAFADNHKNYPQCDNSTPHNCE